MQAYVEACDRQAVDAPNRLRLPRCELTMVEAPPHAARDIATVTAQGPADTMNARWDPPGHQ